MFYIAEQFKIYHTYLFYLFHNIFHKDSPNSKLIDIKGPSNIKQLQKWTAQHGIYTNIKQLVWSFESNVVNYWRDGTIIAFKNCKGWSYFLKAIMVPEANNYNQCSKKIAKFSFRWFTRDFKIKILKFITSKFKDLCKRIRKGIIYMSANWQGNFFLILIFNWKLITSLNIQSNQFKYWILFFKFVLLLTYRYIFKYTKKAVQILNYIVQAF